MGPQILGHAVQNVARATGRPVFVHPCLKDLSLKVLNLETSHRVTPIKMEVVGFSKTSVTTDKTTRCHTEEDSFS